MVNTTFRLSEDELLKLGFSRIAARALRYVFEAVGNGEVSESSLTELTQLVTELVSTPDNTSSIMAQVNRRLEEFMITHSQASEIARLERRISDMEKLIAGSA